ncbi:DUF1573 domain-containing protein [Bernardetia sp.]|uniref:DUF1573 domain-containing protein n=1 Tax=Bernardetia sp. TaxID=1937974 RepID=UPI0025B8D93E|nr:DUF1573 domain-containing protein [Bernardetia sp.]
MKKTFFLSLLGTMVFFFGQTTLQAQTTNDKTTFTKKADDRQAKLTFTDREHDFGEVEEGEVVERVFTFKNTGDYPLMLQDIRTTCGCTAPEWTKEPIAPNEEGKIIVRFNSAHKAGQQRKVITVISNASNSSESLVLFGTVLPKGGSK